MRPVSWSTSYLLREPFGISTSTSKSKASSFRLPMTGLVSRTTSWISESESSKMAVREKDHAEAVPRHRIRRFLAWLPDVVVVLLVVAAAANLQLDLGRRWFGAEP